MKKIEIAAVKVKTALNRFIPDSKYQFFASGIITAGGSGTRMGGVAKQFMNICEIPCIVYSLKAFQSCPEINEIIVVCRQGDEETIRTLCENYGISKLSAVVPGGATRQQSVANGFAAVCEKSDFVAIHDAARPLILSKHISMLLKNARRYGAACAAMKVSDTIKRARGEMILETVSRDDLYSVQTPQVFKTDLYRVSLALFQNDPFDCTDDCSLAEHAGFPIRLCELDHPNFKITTPQDLLTVESIIKERNHG